MILGSRFWRMLGGLAVVLALGVLAARLLPVYFRNLEFQRFLEETVARPENRDKPDEQLRVAVLDRASRLGLPVRDGQVRLLRPEGKLRLEVRYTVPVEMPLYTVDLHFHPKAGGR